MPHSSSSRTSRISRPQNGVRSQTPFAHLNRAMRLMVDATDCIVSEHFSDNSPHSPRTTASGLSSWKSIPNENQHSLDSPNNEYHTGTEDGIATSRIVGACSNSAHQR